MTSPTSADTPVLADHLLALADRFLALADRFLASLWLSDCLLADRLHKLHTSRKYGSLLKISWWALSVELKVILLFLVVINWARGLFKAGLVSALLASISLISCILLHKYFQSLGFHVPALYSYQLLLSRPFMK